jgi:hypothetical protein
VDRTPATAIASLILSGPPVGEALSLLMVSGPPVEEALSLLIALLEFLEVLVHRERDVV